MCFLKLSARSKKIIIILVQLLITLVFLDLTFKHIYFKDLWVVFHQINFHLGLFSVIPQVLGCLILALREKYLLKSIHSFSYRELLNGVFINNIGNNILPLRAGEFLKVLYWSSVSKASYVSLLSVAFIVRMLDIICVFIILAIASLKYAAFFNINIYWMMAGFALIFFPMLILLFLDFKFELKFALPQKLQRLLGKKISMLLPHFLNKVMVGFRVITSMRTLTYAFVLSLIYWSVNFIYFLILLYAFHISVTFSLLFVLVSAAAVGNAIPSSPANIGTWDYFVKSALVLFAVSETTAVSFALFSHAFAVVSLFVVGVFFIYPIIFGLMKKGYDE